MMTGHYPYEKKEDYPLPWLKCLWCNYKDKVERDLGWHFIEKHKSQLYKISPFEFRYDIEYNINEAMELVKRKAATDPENKEDTKK